MTVELTPGNGQGIVPKAQIGEISFVIILITTIALCFIFAAFVYKSIQPQINGISFATNESVAAYNQFETAFPIFDHAMIFIIVGLTIGLLVTSFLIPTHPVFLVVNIFGFMILVFLAAVMSNTYYNVAAMDPLLLNVTQQYYPATNYVMQYLPIICVGIIALSTIILFGKSQAGGGVYS